MEEGKGNGRRRVSRTDNGKERKKGGIRKGERRKGWRKRSEEEAKE